MKVFSDVELKNEVNIKHLDLGTVEIGETKEYTFYVLNDSPSKITNFSFAINDNRNEMKVLEYPRIINAREIGIIKFEWTPSDIEEKTEVEYVFKGHKVI